jgi:uncharacterized protein YegP (UPF0339 family)
MSEFSRRVNVEIIKDEPTPRDQFMASSIWASHVIDAEYSKYLDRFQPYRWRAIAANNEPIAHRERYFNLADCVNAVELNYGDDTTAYRMAVFGEDLSETLLRLGATDRASQA